MLISRIMRAYWFLIIAFKCSKRKSRAYAAQCKAVYLEALSTNSTVILSAYYCWQDDELKAQCCGAGIQILRLHTKFASDSNSEPTALIRSEAILDGVSFCVLIPQSLYNGHYVCIVNQKSTLKSITNPLGSLRQSHSASAYQLQYRDNPTCRVVVRL